LDTLGITDGYFADPGGQGCIGCRTARLSDRRSERGRHHGEITRYELPAIGALNFVLKDTLGGGVTRSLALAAHGKSLSSAILELDIAEWQMSLGMAGQQVTASVPHVAQDRLVQIAILNRLDKIAFTSQIPVSELGRGSVAECRISLLTPAIWEYKRVSGRFLGGIRLERQAPSASTMSLYIWANARTQNFLE
jgi:hypothetical protein